MSKLFCKGYQQMAQVGKELPQKVVAYIDLDSVLGFFVKFTQKVGTCNTVKPVLSSHSKEDQRLDFKTDCHLMHVKRIAECSKRAFCNAFDLHLATICL